MKTLLGTEKYKKSKPSVKRIYLLNVLKTLESFGKNWIVVKENQSTVDAIINNQFYEKKPNYVGKGEEIFYIDDIRSCLY
jgi:hypothetical protein